MGLYKHRKSDLLLKSKRLLTGYEEIKEGKCTFVDFVLFSAYRNLRHACGLVEILSMQTGMFVYSS